MNRLVELLLGHLHNRIQLLVDHQVNGKVQPPEKPHRRLHSPVHVFYVVHVAPNPNGSSSQLLDFLGALNCCCFPNITQGQIRPVPSHLLTQHHTNPAGRPKDDPFAPFDCK